MATVTTNNAYYTAIAEALRAKTGGTETYKPAQMAAAISVIPSGGSDAGTWVRPSNWPNYDLLDRTNMEAVFFTYDCRYAIEKPELEDWMCVIATTSSGQWKLERGYIDTTGFHAVWSSTAVSNTPIFNLLPTDEGDFVVYRLTADGSAHLTQVSMKSNTSGGTNETVYAQHCVERWGRLPYVTSFTGSHSSIQWGCHHVVSESIIDCTAVTSLRNCWNSCTSLQQLDFTGWDTGGVTTMLSCFAGCASLKRLDLTGWDTGNVTTLQNCFNACTKLQYLDLSGWDVTTVTNIGYCFADCRSLQYLKLTGWNPLSVTSTGSAFYNCVSLSSFLPCPMHIAFSLSSSGLLSHDSLVALLQALPETTTAKTVTLGAVNTAKLTEAEIAIATGKGWTVA